LNTTGPRHLDPGVPTYLGENGNCARNLVVGTEAERFVIGLKLRASWMEFSCEATE
jgi:hypothetical protein